MQFRSTFSRVYVAVSLVDRAPLASRLPMGLDVEEYDDRGVVATSIVVQKTLRPDGFPKRFGVSAVFAEHLAFVKRPADVVGARHGFFLLHITSPTFLFRVGSVVSPYQVVRAPCSIEDSANNITITGGTSMELSRGSKVPSNWDATASLRRVRLHNFATPRRPSGSLRVYRGVLKNWSPKPLLIDSFDSDLIAEEFGEVEPVTAFEVSDVDYRWGRAK